jgi:hypothetical protein
MQVKAIIARWGRRYDPDVLTAMLWMPVVTDTDLGNAAAMQEWCQELARRLGVGLCRRGQT